MFFHAPDNGGVIYCSAKWEVMFHDVDVFCCNVLQCLVDTAGNVKVSGMCHDMNVAVFVVFGRTEIVFARHLYRCGAPLVSSHQC
jgi:hypothetical protein